jgi:hypothetical protein
MCIITLARMDKLPASVIVRRRFADRPTGERRTANGERRTAHGGYLASKEEN